MNQENVEVVRSFEAGELTPFQADAFLTTA